LKTVTFTEFRKNASSLFSDVEKGETLLVLRHGKPIAEIFPAGATLGRCREDLCNWLAMAEIFPASSEGGAGRSWQRPGLRLTAKGASLSLAILEERRREDVL